MYNWAVILQSCETYCPTLRASGVTEQRWRQYSNYRLQLQLWYGGNYTLQCVIFCQFSCSSIWFTTLCGLWLSRPGHSKSCYWKPVLSNYSHSSASYDYTHHPAIVFVVFLSVDSPLVSGLIFHLPFFRSPCSEGSLITRSFKLPILYTPPYAVVSSHQAFKTQKFYTQFDW